MTEMLEDRMAALEARVLALEQNRNAVSRSAGQSDRLSPREFLLGKAPKTDNDKTLAAGYYIEVITGKESFTFEDLEVFYGQAKEQVPSNRRDPPYQNVRRGYFRELGAHTSGRKARNAWALTNSGIDRVEKGFPTRGRQ